MATQLLFKRHIVYCTGESYYLHTGWYKCNYPKLQMCFAPKQTLLNCFCYLRNTLCKRLWPASFHTEKFFKFCLYNFSAHACVTYHYQDNDVFG